MRNTAARNDIRLLLKINYRLFTSSVIIEFLSAPQFFTYIETVDDEAKDMEINDAHDRTLRPSEQITATANMCADIIKKKKRKRKSKISQVRLRRSVSSLKASACSLASASETFKYLWIFPACTLTINLIDLHSRARAFYRNNPDGTKRQRSCQNARERTRLLRS